jgi:rifampin ADP-ribosyltransferase
VSNNIYFTALVDTAAWGAELATALAGSGERGHIYVVEPLGPFEDDPDVLKAMLDRLALLREQGLDLIED